MRQFTLVAVIVWLFIIFCNAEVLAQPDSVAPNKPFRPGRLTAVALTESAIATATLIGLNELWYKDYPRSSFHFFNDNAEWFQMDKLGHAYTSYQVGKLGYAALRWSGVKENKSIWYGGATGLAYQLIVEMLDGYSTAWGFSTGDFAANMGGAALFTSQQLLWHEQRILMKFSYQYTPYAEYRPETLGSNAAERLLKDYNGQTYWLSASPGAFMKDTKKFPPWLCFSVGMGAKGMLGARDNDPAPLNYPNDQRNRIMYLSMDLDLSKIPVKSKFWHTVLSVVNTLKVPFPGLAYNLTRNHLEGQWISL